MYWWKIRLVLQKFFTWMVACSRFYSDSILFPVGEMKFRGTHWHGPSSNESRMQRSTGLGVNENTVTVDMSTSISVFRDVNCTDIKSVQ